ncbi:FecR domain-containing protein [Spirosoma knui]
MDPIDIQRLIQRYRTGTATPEERQQLEQLWQDALTDQSALEDLQADEQNRLEEKMYQGAVQRIQQQEPGAFRPVIAIGQRRWWLAAAASVTGILLVLAGWWFMNRLGGAQGQLSFETQYGEKKRIELPEGSIVWLNGHSSLRFETDSAGNRRAWLTGEALFSIKHTPTHQKFVVHTTRQLNIEVLGTVFNVTDRRGNVSVTLQSGSVRVVDQTQRQPDVLLKPGEMVVAKKPASATTPVLQKSVVQAELSTAWKDGSLYVEDKPLGELFDWMEDTYGVDIQCSDELRQETFAGSVRTDSLDSFFLKLEKLYQVRVNQSGNVYQIN